MHQYVYHKKPESLIGNKLIPLNVLKETEPKLYEKYIEKYKNTPKRMKLLEREIPLLNCLWNDVVFFSPLHPFYIYEAQKKLGIEPKEINEFYKIPIEALRENVNALYSPKRSEYKGPDYPIDPKDIVILNSIEEYREEKEIPTDTIEHYEKCLEHGIRIQTFPFVPHFLSLGSVDLSEAKIISWHEKP